MMKLMAPAILGLLLCAAALTAGDKTVFDYMLNTIGGQPLRVHAAVFGVGSDLREVQGPRLRDRRNSREQFWRAGTRHEPGDQDLLPIQIQREVPDDVQSFREGRRPGAAVSISDGQVGESKDRRRYQVEFYEVPRGAGWRDPCAL